MTKQYPLPDWEAHCLAEAAGISQMLFVYDTQEVDRTLIGATFPDLEKAELLSSRPAFRSDRFSIKWPSIPAGWSEFGMFGPRPGSIVEEGSLQIGAIAWFFFFEWDPVRSAWNALLDGQDSLRPQKTSLTPEFILPSMFLTRMAHFPFDGGIHRVGKQWVACFTQAQTSLLPLITGLFREWMNGSSQAARRYRRLSRSRLSLQPDQEAAILLWQRTFGSALLEHVRGTERLEPTLIRRLDTASAQLWTDGAFSFDPQRSQLIRALLPIAQWQPHPPASETLHLENTESLESLFQAWSRWRAQK
jgi:hypothetical protein